MMTNISLDTLGLKRISRLGGPVLPFAAAIPLLFMHSRQATPPTQSANSDARLAVEPDVIDLGTLPPGESAVAALTLRNLGTTTVVVDRIETSCPCVAIELNRVDIAPSAEVALTVCFDPAAEPDFRGGLAVEVIGREPSGEIAFHVDVTIFIVSPTSVISPNDNNTDSARIPPSATADGVGFRPRRVAKCLVREARLLPRDCDDVTT